MKCSLSIVVQAPRLPCMSSAVTVAFKVIRPIFIIVYKLKQKLKKARTQCCCSFMTCLRNSQTRMFQSPKLSFFILYVHDQNSCIRFTPWNVCRCNSYQYVFHALLNIHSKQLFPKLYEIFLCSLDSLSQEFWFYFQIHVKRGAVTLYYGDLNDSVPYPNPAVFHNNTN